MGLDKKFELARRMADGEVFTSLGPAERSAIREVLDEFEILRVKYNERGNVMWETSATTRSLFMPYIKRISDAAREPGHPNDAIAKIQNILDELNKHTPIG